MSKIELEFEKLKRKWAFQVQQWQLAHIILFINTVAIKLSKPVTSWDERILYA